jgi:hypothetical protein
MVGKKELTLMVAKRVCEVRAKNKTRVRTLCVQVLTLKD